MVTTGVWEEPALPSPQACSVPEPERPSDHPVMDESLPTKPGVMQADLPVASLWVFSWLHMRVLWGSPMQLC
jgi:hypothetical protein